MENFFDREITKDKRGRVHFKNETSLSKIFLIASDEVDSN